MAKEAEKEAFERFKDEGFIKTADLPVPLAENDQKAALNRKGNELFNQGNVEAARRIFQTTGYSDGLIRVGDKYVDSNRPVDALKMYWLAHEKNRAQGLIEKIAFVIQNLLKEEEGEHERSDDSGR